MSEKIQKVLARAGLGSRREIETWIEAGRIKVGGALATLGDRIEDGQTVYLDGKPLKLLKAHENRRRVLLYNKPEGEICSRRDPEGRRSVFESLPKLKGERWIAVGRLDYNTAGLLLFTTDGELANALMHPSNQIEREYAVRVMGEVSEEALSNLLQGVMLDDGMAKFSDIQPGRNERDDSINKWYYVTLCEGRNREVRRLWESQGLTVSRLKRVRYGNVFIPSKVKAGQWIELNDKEVKTVSDMANLPAYESADILPAERRQMQRQERKAKPRRGGR
ncbi:MAG TPA: pseudouridine synthase [Pseudomonadales bacterium]|nr:pseudouridine synthase [Pseudomonadales bacterium]